MWTSAVESVGTTVHGRAASRDVNDRKEVEARLRVSEARLTFAQEAAGAGIWHWNLVTDAVEWTDQLYRVFGLDPRTAPPASVPAWRAALHPEDAHYAETQVAEAIANRRQLVSEHRIVLPTGEVRWVMALGSTTYDAEGRPVEISGICLDTTERKRAETALRGSEERFRTLAENAPVAIARFDRALRYTYVNEYGARLHGLSATDMVGRTAMELGISPARAAFWSEQFEHAVVSGTQRTVDFEFDSPVFGRRYLSSVLVPEPGEDFSILAITHDVTQLKRAEHSVRESEARFRRLADAMPQFVWTARTDGTIDYCNARATEATGVTRGEDATVLWERAVYAEDLESTVSAWRSAVQDGHTFELTHRLEHADGSTHWYLSRAIPVRDAEGRVVEWFGTTTDIDVQKRTEAALLEADRQKNDFLAMLSHDLRNPFAVIRTSLALLERAGADSPPGKRAFTVLGRQVNQIGRMLDDLLDMTRISKGKLLLTRERLELNDIVRGIGEDHAEVFAREGVDFKVIVPPGALWARVDCARLTQAIGNLLQNAAKFTPAGGHVTLSLHGTDDDEAVVDVRDTGVGVQPELLGRLFDPLVQAHRTLHQSRGGLGLGLALVKGIAELHGGSVGAASDGPGHGAVFTIRLPLEH